MQALEKNLRNQLERTVKQARQVAEAAAQATLEQLGAGERHAPAYLDYAGGELRRRLRSHGRQLGDMLQADGIQSPLRLREEIAYEHWHRMLFARFLAENNLLMYPDPDEPVAVTLEECEDLAADEGAANGWELAARFAARMLPQIFRPDSPVFQLVLPPEHQQKLERLVAGLPESVFTASDSLGWVYQFWQADNKERINKAEVKIGADELPAVTQLFTEPYMVSFLLDNSLGAWWAARRLTAADLQNAQSEGELRAKAAIPGVPLTYLRFVREETGSWTPAAGIFAAWPATLDKLKTLDPCCGSGHFLVAAFLMLVPMRMELEGLSAREAANRVLSDNLHGLELDQRCVELAAFAVALTAWRYPAAGGYRNLPELHIACSGLSVQAAKADWKQLALDKKNLVIALDWMHTAFKDAPVLGSLLNPAKTQAAKVVQWEELSTLLGQALSKEQSSEQQEAAVVAQGLAKAAQLLAGQYQWVITNVPYRKRADHCDVLRDFCEKYYPEGKNDLATVFLDRCLELCSEKGTASIVLPQNWLFLTSYRKFREKMLHNHTWHIVARLGAGAFETIHGEVVKAILINISRSNTNNNQDDLFASTGEAALLRGLDVAKPRTAAEKAVQLLTVEIKTVEQAKQLENPDARVALEDSEDIELLTQYANALQGIASADYPYFGRYYWELLDIDQIEWVFQQSTVDKTSYFSGKEHVLFWQGGKGSLVQSSSARVQGLDAWSKWGVAVSQMREMPVTLHLASSFDNNSSVIIPFDESHLPAIWCFCSSSEYNEAVRRIDQKLNVTNATLVKVPFDLGYWTQVAEERYPHGLPKPYSDDPTQWIFHGHPMQSTDPLQVAAARLLGYRWPAETDPDMELDAEARHWIAQCESLQTLVDDDGIVCIPPVRGEPAASERLLDLLVAAYGEYWGTDVLARLLKAADHADKTLDTWLREKFFTQHCKLFQHRPFIWHIWDGLRDGFAALVNYHQFDHKALETLIYTYLGDWITRQKKDIETGTDGAQEKLAAAEQLKHRLELILHGEAPYDIFVRWKPLAQQPLGWEPDLNDGVRLNIRPFLSVPDVGKKGAGVLRDKPNINWGKDRGKDVESAPWYPVFAGERINDHHLTVDEKRKARENTTP
ncbi:MAG: restriction endonuclease subunit M [Thiothrix lacustris]|uniref:site-specific DNA-methyltransferase (adenine-specific) n=1 Tax=Thiothrix lacustris TaxID=525917 RepID=A0A1Y1QUU2_9GAMM|nr:MAG: restriction endonuclease subunit M [Thiothrix lacustris]